MVTYHHPLQFETLEDELASQLKEALDYGESFKIESIREVSNTTPVALPAPTAPDPAYTTTLEKLADHVRLPVEQVEQAIKAGTFRFKVG
jgi:hypothetical protein